MIKALVLVGHATIIDGDTLTLVDALDYPVNIRIAGIDTPERGQDGFAEATLALQKITHAKSVRCTWDGQLSYQRLVARCSVEGQDLGAAMILNGHAGVICRFAGQHYNNELKVVGKPLCD